MKKILIVITSFAAIGAMALLASAQMNEERPPGFEEAAMLPDFETVSAQPAAIVDLLVQPSAQDPMLHEFIVSGLERLIGEGAGQGFALEQGGGGLYCPYFESVPAPPGIVVSLSVQPSDQNSVRHEFIIPGPKSPEGLAAGQRFAEATGGPGRYAKPPPPGRPVLWSS